MSLKYIAVGTGRDGTQSLAHLISECFRLNGIRATATHEYLSRECYNAYCSFKETGDQKYLDDIGMKLADCPYEAIVGNGYASLLPMIRTLFPDVALIHLKRLNREAVVSSLVKSSRLFPEVYLYYGATEGIMRRVAAFHEKAMSREDWEILSLVDKFSWYYDYTHGAIEKEKRRFTRHLDLNTEALSDTATLENLCTFVTKCSNPRVPDAVRLNRHSYLNIDDFGEDSRSYAQWLFGTLSASQIAQDTVYLSEYVTNKYISLTGSQLTGFVKEFASAYAVDPQELSRSLNRFETLLLQRLKEVGLLKADLARRIDEDEHGHSEVKCPVSSKS